MPAGDEPAPTIGVGLRYARRWLPAALILACLLLEPAASASASSSQMAAGPAVATSGTSALLTLVSQTTWVQPSQPFDLHLRIGNGTLDPALLGISVAVYSCLSSVSAFDQSVAASGPSGTPISSTQSPVPLNGLPELAGGEFDLSMPVTVGQSGPTGPTGSTGGFTIHLTSAGVQCGAYPSGVYPVRLELIDTSGGNIVGSITTHLVYVGPGTGTGTGTRRLRFALVLPVQATMPPAPRPSPAQLLARPSAALELPTASALAGVTGVVNAAAKGHPTVPVTFEASGQTIELLKQQGRQSTWTQLTQLATAPAVHQFASAPFTPVNAAALVDVGLGNELSAQVVRGSQVLSSLLHPQATPTTAASVTDLGAWITNDNLNDPTLASLAADGYTRVILPSASVTSTPVNGSTAESFQVGTGRSSMTALASNSDLAVRFTTDPGNPVLAAHQLVAELAQLYYEKPNAIAPRGVVAVPPSSWSANPLFIDTLMGSLESSPIIQPVTVSALFDLFPSVATCRTACKLVAATGGSGIPAGAVRTQRRRIDDFSSAAPSLSARPLIGQLGELVLAGEAETLRPAQQSKVISNTGAALDAQLGQLVVAGDQNVTLTSQRGTVPITIVKSTPYPVVATLILTSDKLLFGTAGTTQWTQTVTLAHPTNPYYITVRTRAAGVFKVGVVLRSPSGTLILSSGAVDVRSTATSVVGIALSAGAVAVLVVWWIRTSRKRRSRRRDDELDAAAPSSVAP